MTSHAASNKPPAQGGSAFRLLALACIAVSLLHLNTESLLSTSKKKAPPPLTGVLARRKKSGNAPPLHSDRIRTLLGFPSTDPLQMHHQAPLPSDRAARQSTATTLGEEKEDNAENAENQKEHAAPVRVLPPPPLPPPHLPPPPLPPPPLPPPPVDDRPRVSSLGASALRRRNSLLSRYGRTAFLKAAQTKRKATSRMLIAAGLLWLIAWGSQHLFGSYITGCEMDIQGLVTSGGEGHSQRGSGRASDFPPLWIENQHLWPFGFDKNTYMLVDEFPLEESKTQWEEMSLHENCVSGIDNEVLFGLVGLLIATPAFALYAVLPVVVGRCLCFGMCRFTEKQF